MLAVIRGIWKQQQGLSFTSFSRRFFLPTMATATARVSSPPYSTGSPIYSPLKRVGIHNGSFHCDEALGCFMMRLTSKFSDAEIVRTRDPQGLEGLDAVLDVGGVYDPRRDRYDHHQKGFGKVFGHGFLTQLSSAGLVYKHFGKEIILKELQVNEDHPDVLRLYLYYGLRQVLSVEASPVRAGRGDENRSFDQICSLSAMATALSPTATAATSRQRPRQVLFSTIPPKPSDFPCFRFIKQFSPLKALAPPRYSSPMNSSDLSSTTTPASSTSTMNLRSRLQKGETLYGIFLLSFSPTIAEIAGLAGYDFGVVDMEHGPGGISDALHCLRALAATRTPAILRLPESSAAWAKKALDLGPQGIMFPMIDSPKAAKKAVSYCRFPPGGIRGSAHTVVRASGYGIDEGYLTNYADELLIMCQVECHEGVKKIDEIAAVDGVDCIQMGPLDLSASMGYLWDPGNKKVKAVLREAEKGVLESTKKKGGGGAYLAGFAMPHDSPAELRSRGYHMVSGAVDLGMFRSAAVEDVRRFKAAATAETDKDDGDEKYWSE